MSENRWWEYVQRLIGDDTYKEAAQRAGFDQSAFTRWRKGAQPDVAFVVKLARGYHSNVLEALVEAGFITEQEAALREIPTQSHREMLEVVDSELLMQEVLKRVRNTRESSGASDRPAPDGGR